MKIQPGSIKSPMTDYREYWERGMSWPVYFDTEVEAHRALWEGVYRKSRIPEWVSERIGGIGGEWKILVLTEDWCGDAVNTVPVFARLAEAVPRIEVRLLKRDESPALMDRYLTKGARSIPIAIVLDDRFEPVGQWGPRPRELQEFVLGEKQKGERPAEEIYRDARAWYARDRGETALNELLEVIEAGEAGGRA